MFNYLIIETKENISDVKHLVIDVMASLINVKRVIDSDHRLFITFDRDADVLFDDVIHNLAMDLYMDIRLYVSYTFQDEVFMIKHRDFIQKLLKDIPFNRYTYLDDEIIAKHMMTKIEKNDYQFFLRNYVHDDMMLKTVKTYLESNQNMSVAAKKLYVHRNTMMQRIDKFIDATGFDIKTFVSASIIYYFLTH